MSIDDATPERLPFTDEIPVDVGRSASATRPKPDEEMEVQLDRDRFTRELLRELAGVLEDAVGVEEAEGFISLVGGRMGLRINQQYLDAYRVDRLDHGRVAATLVDLKRRIDGDFTVEHVDADRIVLVNSRCPFGAYVEDRQSLCMMTSNVFGRIGADNLGYARVELEETIAAGQGRCRVVVHLGEGVGGREYFG